MQQKQWGLVTAFCSGLIFTIYGYVCYKIFHVCYNFNVTCYAKLSVSILRLYMKVLEYINKIQPHGCKLHGEVSKIVCLVTKNPKTSKRILLTLQSFGGFCCDFQSRQLILIRMQWHFGNASKEEFSQRNAPIFVGKNVNPGTIHQWFWENQLQSLLKEA